MIDIENAVINNLILAARSQFASTYPGLCVYSITPEVPESFPCIVVEMLSDITATKTLEFGKTSENHADVTFQIDVYCNNGDNRKQTAKTIFSFLDTTMQNMGFVRILATPTPNIDRTIYRITGRYTGRVDEGTTKTVDGEQVIEYLVFK